MVKKNAIKFITILTIMICMEGVKTSALINHQIYCDLYLADIEDSAISNHHHLFDTFEQENWNMPNSQSDAFLQGVADKQIISKPLVKQELCNSIWQPPKLV